MSLQAIRVFDKVWKWSSEKTAPQKQPFQCFKDVKLDKWPDLSRTHFSPIDCCAKINGAPDHLFSSDSQS